MAMALLCRTKGFFRYQLCGRLFSSADSQSFIHFPFTASSSRYVPVVENKCPSLAIVLSSYRLGLQRPFSAEATSYPNPAPPGDFDDFPDAGDGDYESGAEDDDPPPDPDEGALYSPSESEN